MKYTTKRFISKAFGPISRMGYTRDDTANYITTRFEELDPCDETSVNRFYKWVDRRRQGRQFNDYIDRVWATINQDELGDRDLNVVCSAINSYLKAVRAQEERDNNPSQYVGNIKDKIELTVKEVRFLYSKYYGYGYSGTEYNVYRIVGTDNNIYIWGTAGIVEEGDTITATVKDHRDYKGEKQTVITRGKIVYKNKNDDLSVMETLGGDYED